MLTPEKIEIGKANANIPPNGGLHQHHDCIRIAYEWLDAQKKLKNPSKKQVASKHLIENWSGRYVSASDVIVAAYLHPDIKGEYPYLNIGSRLIEPSKERLKNIGEAFTHHYHEHHRPSAYSTQETL